MENGDTDLKDYFSTMLLIYHKTATTSSKKSQNRISTHKLDLAEKICKNESNNWLK